MFGNTPYNAGTRMIAQAADRYRTERALRRFQHRR